jgi:hypothetical protein
MIADGLNETFARHSIQCTREPSLPSDLGKDGLAIVAAHGGMVDTNRYFRAVSDENTLRLGSSAFAQSIGTSCVAVLFVCSAGRLDRHPTSGTTVGLVKQLLNRGCRAVVASSWPLSAFVPLRWLPQFLQEWDSDAPLIDACFAANAAVRKTVGFNAAECLAMFVTGDPLVTRNG